MVYVHLYDFYDGKSHSITSFSYIDNIFSFYPSIYNFYKKVNPINAKKNGVELLPLRFLGLIFRLNSYFNLRPDLSLR